MRTEIALLLLCGLSLLSAGCDRRSGPAGQGEDNASVPTSGEVVPSAAAPKSFDAKIDRSHAGKDAPDFVFSGADNKDVSLADFRGRPMLVNLWATWCGPCVAEMPTLDTVAARYGKAGLAVLAVSQDMGDAAEVAAFFAKRKLPNLTLYRDPENQLGFHYATGLLPTTVLYNRQGREVARVAGAMDWSGKQAEALIDEALE
ncbi:MAG TPA: TlpA disulfide reductase family protein [Sphingobium sp.]|nr:TlpA disulfide reductase family protein [Sphingobium sp.]